LPRINLVTTFEHYRRATLDVFVLLVVLAKPSFLASLHISQLSLFEATALLDSNIPMG
jgi:hypothetical protein